jgi:transcriptional regulator with XRE-family HTH domain
MESLKHIREQLGISQQYLAILLDTRRTLLSMAEIGKRDLPAKALATLVQLQQNIPQDLPTANASPHKKFARGPATALDRLHDWAITKGKDYLQLASDMEAAYQQAILKREMLPALFPEPNRKQAVVLSLIEMANEEIIAKCSPALSAWCRKTGEHLSQMPGLEEKNE